MLDMNTIFSSPS